MNTADLGIGLFFGWIAGIWSAVAILALGRYGG